MRANEGRTPGEEQTWIVGRSFKERMKNFGCLRKVFRHEMAHSEELTDKLVIGMSRQLPLQRRNSFGVKLGAIAGETPIAIEAGKGRFPGSSLFEKFGGFGKCRVFRTHDT